MPDWKKIVQERVDSLKIEGAAGMNLAEELAQHLEARFEEHVSGGATEREAYEATVAELEEMHPLERHSLNAKEPAEFLEPSGGSFFDDLWRDFRFALRTMRKSPVFVLFVVLTLGLGIGANTTVFTVINTLLLNPLPVPDSGRLFAFGQVKSGARGNSAALPVSYADFKDFRAGNADLHSLAAYSSPRPVTWQTGTGSGSLFVELVSGNYFSTLGIKPTRGRFFLPNEDGAPGAHPVAILNYGTWMARFSGADVIGKTLTINRIAFTVVGIAPPRFIGVNGLFGPDLWVPAAMAEQLLPDEMRAALTDRNKAMFRGVGRLDPGLKRVQVQAVGETIALDLAREYPDIEKGHTVVVKPIRDALFASSMGDSTPVVSASAGLLIVVGIVLLIACSNVANLLLARSAARRHEITVRLALGASRRRLIRQLLTESVILGCISGAMGLSIGYAGLRVLFGALPSTANFIAPKFDATVFLYALALSLATGLCFGIIPAFKSSRGSVAETLNQEARTAGRSSGKVTLANVLLIAQIAFSFLLLMTAVLFLRSIGRAYSIDPGFQTAHLAVIMTSPGQAGYGEPQIKQFYKDVRERVMSMPAVKSVSWGSNLPLWARPVSGMEIEARAKRSRAEQITAIVETVDTNYFETAGVRVDQGREFMDSDRESSISVAMVNEKMAHEFWPGGRALGKRIQLPGEPKWREIVGITRNANYTTWSEPPQLCVYVPLRQNLLSSMVLYVRSKGDPTPLLPPIRRELAAAAPEIAGNIPSRTGREIVDGGLFQAKIGVTLLSVFGLLALGLANIGLYGILAYSVGQRQREIGVRMALGSRPGDVVRLVLKQGMSLVATGVLIGIALSLIVGRLISRMLFGVSPTDLASLGAAAVLLLGVALLACYVPGRRASSLDPLIALRET